MASSFSGQSLPELSWEQRSSAPIFAVRIVGFAGYVRCFIAGKEKETAAEVAHVG
jgi:hypothetical protein